MSCKCKACVLVNCYSNLSALDQFTTILGVVNISNVKAINLLDERIILSEGSFVEVVAWEVSKSLEGSEHKYRYRLTLVINSDCVMRYGNETGKGDHKHIGSTEIEYNFTDIDRLLADFWNDVGELT